MQIRDDSPQWLRDLFPDAETFPADRKHQPRQRGPVVLPDEECAPVVVKEFNPHAKPGGGEYGRD